jgi:hypothetical protein
MVVFIGGSKGEERLDFEKAFAMAFSMGFWGGTLVETKCARLQVERICKVEFWFENWIDESYE